MQADGLLSQEHARQLEQALRSSRTIGAAMGMIMPTRQVAEDEAFAILSSASQQSNRKVRELAADLVQRATSSDQLHP
jgi:AmiR/NasT family two-component response regulator